MNWFALVKQKAECTPTRWPDCRYYPKYIARDESFIPGTIDSSRDCENALLDFPATDLRLA
jgi:hypothetical protein